VRADRFEPLLRQRLEEILSSPLPISTRLQRATEVLDLAAAAELSLDLWEAQNRFYRLLRTARAQDAGPPLRTLGDHLGFNMDRLSAEILQAHP
jgi:hypothetical protein